MITITRYTDYGNFEKETFGVLTFGEFTCYTVERPWMDNAPSISCIPNGKYLLHSYDSPKFGNSVIIYGGSVSPYPDPDFERNGILIHPANIANDVQGCIGLGDNFGTVYGEHAVLNSKKTVSKFLDLINTNEIYNLEIVYDTHG
jgi:hypothetical protein